MWHSRQSTQALEAKARRTYGDRITTTPAQLTKAHKRTQAMMRDALPSNVPVPDAQVTLFKRDRNGVDAAVSTSPRSRTNPVSGPDDVHHKAN